MSCIISSCLKLIISHITERYNKEKSSLSIIHKFHRKYICENFLEDIQYIIAKLKYRNIGVIITDHNVGETLAITDRAYLLYEGTILQEGTPAQLAADEDVRTKYLGSGFQLKRSVSVQRAKDDYEAMLRQKENK